MRIGILVVLAVFAVACTTTKDGPSSVTQTLKGKSWTTKSNPSQSETRHELDAMESGQPVATVIADAVFKTHAQKAAVDPSCPPEYKWGTPVVSLTWIQTYPDGSSFEGKAKNPAGWPVCTDGTSFHLKEVEGDIKKGKGKFKNVKDGTWKADITVGRKCNPTDKCPTTGNFEASFQY